MRLLLVPAITLFLACGGTSPSPEPTMSEPDPTGRSKQSSAPDDAAVPEEEAMEAGASEAGTDDAGLNDAAPERVCPPSQESGCAIEKYTPGACPGIAPLAFKMQVQCVGSASTGFDPNSCEYRGGGPGWRIECCLPACMRREPLDCHCAGSSQAYDCFGTAKAPATSCSKVGETNNVSTYCCPS